MIMYMDKNETSKELFNSQIDKDPPSNDYEYLVLRLKSIKESIALLEKNFLAK